MRDRAPNLTRINAAPSRFGSLLLSLVLAALVSLPARADGDEPWTLDSLVRTIEDQHPLMRAARAGLEQLEAKLHQAEWAYFPSFKLDAGVTLTPKVTGNALGSHTDWDRPGGYFKISLDMVQPLWTFGKIESLQRAARAGAFVGHAAIEAARWELRARAAEAWNGALLSRALGEILKDGKGWIDKAEAHMERLKAADSDDYDQMEHLRLKTRIAEFFELQAQNLSLRVKAEQGLRLLIRETPGVHLTLADQALEPYDIQTLDPDRCVGAMRESDPSIALARGRARASQALADAKAAEQWPDIVLVGEVKLTEANQIEDQQSYFANDPYHDRVAGAALGLRWKLDVPQRIFQTDEARAQARRATAEADLQADLQEFKVRQLVQEIENKRELISIYATSQKAAQGWLAATWDTYDAGFGSFRDVMDALVQFYEKKFSYLRVVFEFNTSIWKLSQAIGVDVRTWTAPAGD